MKRALFALVCVFLFAPLAFSQVRIPGIGGVHNSVTVSGGWAYLQGTSGTNGTSGGWEVQNNACGSTTGTFVTACSIQVLPTTAGSAMVIGRVMGSTSTGHITSAYSCATSNPCLSSSGDLKDTFSIFSGNTCLLTNTGNDHDDCAYVVGSVGGATIITVNVSAAPVTFDYAEFGEIQPPNCNGSPCPISVDNSGSPSTAQGNSAGCNPCTGPAFTVTGEDGIIEIIDTNAPVASPSSAYTLDFIGNVFSFDNTTGTGISFNTGNFFTLLGVAFKTNTSYTPLSAPWSNLITATGQGFTSTGSVNCAPTCPAKTLNNAVAQSNALLVVFAQTAPGSTQQTISSVTDNQGNTWTVPAGCKQTSGSIDLSCAYFVTTSASSISTVTVTLSGTSANMYLAAFAVVPSSGTPTLDASSASNVASSNQTLTGQTLTLTGTVDACFAEFGWPETSGSPIEVGASLYPSPWGSNFFGGFSNNSANGTAMMLLNARNGNPPKVLLSGSATSYNSSGICFHN
jgi:hypothetical protein